MFNAKGLMSSIDQHWRTPKKLYEELDKEFHFDFDPCPPNPDFDGLSVDWGETNYCNPPYKNIKHWIKKAYEEHLKGKTVVLLIPSRTDTQYWHEFIMKADEIRLIKGRLKFSEHTGSAPFPSCVVVFKAKKGEEDVYA